MFLLPGEKGKLHIFEERYKQLLDDCRQPGTSFGIPYTQNNYLSGYGCIVEVGAILHTYPNGAADIEIHCIDLFQLQQFFMKMGVKPYPGGEIIPIADTDNSSVSKDLQKALDDYVRDVEPEMLEASLNPQLAIYDIALLVALTEEDKLKLVKATSHQARERILLNHLKILYALHQQKNSIRGNVFLN